MTQALGSSNLATIGAHAANVANATAVVTVVQNAAPVLRMHKTGPPAQQPPPILSTPRR